MKQTKKEMIEEIIDNRFESVDYDYLIEFFCNTLRQKYNSWNDADLEEEYKSYC